MIHEAMHNLRMAQEKIRQGKIQSATLVTYNANQQLKLIAMGYVRTGIARSGIEAVEMAKRNHGPTLAAQLQEHIRSSLGATDVTVTCP